MCSVKALLGNKYEVLDIISKVQFWNSDGIDCTINKTNGMLILLTVDASCPFVVWT